MKVTSEYLINDRNSDKPRGGVDLLPVFQRTENFGHSSYEGGILWNLCVAEPLLIEDNFMAFEEAQLSRFLPIFNV